MYSSVMSVVVFDREVAIGSELLTLFVSYQFYYGVTDFITIPHVIDPNPELLTTLLFVTCPESEEILAGIPNFRDPVN